MRLFSATLALIIATNVAQAESITLLESDIIEPPGASGTNSNPTEAVILEYLTMNPGYSGYTDLGDLLYKADVGGSIENLPLKNSYNIDHSANGGTLTYSGTGEIVDPNSPAFFIVKDGNAGFVIYDLTNGGPFAKGWDGLKPLTWTNAGLYNDKGKPKGISHVQLWGVSTSPDQSSSIIPEPASLSLFGIGFVAMCAYCRRKKSQKLESKSPTNN